MAVKQTNVAEQLPLAKEEARRGGTPPSKRLAEPRMREEKRGPHCSLHCRAGAQASAPTFSHSHDSTLSLGTPRNNTLRKMGISGKIEKD